MYSIRCIELPPFEEYLKFYFEENESNVIDSCRKDYQVITIDGAISELLYPSRVENHQTTHIYIVLFQRLASCGITECIEPRKHDQVSAHLSAVQGAKNLEEISEKEKIASTGVRANNDPSESVFATFYDAVVQGETIRHDHAAGKDQSQ